MTNRHTPETFRQWANIERGDDFTEIRNSYVKDQKKAVVIVELLGNGRACWSADDERHVAEEGISA